MSVSTEARPTTNGAPPAAPAERSAEVEATPTLGDKASYWLLMAGIYWGFGFLWYYPFKSKIFDADGEMPAAVKENFEGKFLDSFPGLDVSWVMLGILEGLVVLGVIASLVRREFLPSRTKPVLFTTLALSILVFAVLLFGERMAGEHETAAHIVGYMATTGVVTILLLMMPPYRPMHWLSKIER